MEITKIYIKKISSCMTCVPYGKLDIRIGWVCHHPTFDKYKKVGKIGEKIQIPSWCPLPDAREYYIEKLQIILE